MRQIYRVICVPLLFSVFLILSLPVLSAEDPLSVEEATWKAGIATAKITPEEPIWQAGYGNRDHPAEGTSQELWIKVLALEAADGEWAVVLTSDLLGFPKGMYESICNQIEKECGVDRAHIMLTASHTHSGPVLKGALYDIYPLDDQQKKRIADYSANLEKTIVATVGEAIKKCSPATLWAGEGSTDFAVNRRNNPQSLVRELRAQGVALKGPEDHTVPVLAVRALDKSLRAVVFGYACHATTLSYYQYSGDYPGFAQIALEQDLPGAVALFHAGCGADQNPLPRRSVALTGKYGYSLADAVEQVLAKPMRPIRPRLETTFKMIELAYEKPLSREELESQREKNIYYQRRANRLLKQLDQGETFAASYSYPVQVWRLGEEQLWITLGGEVVVDYAIQFKSLYGPKTWVTGYCNDVMAYIPSHRVWEEGGYESGAFYVYGLPTDRWAPEIEQRITEAVAELMTEL